MPGWLLDLIVKLAIQFGIPYAVSLAYSIKWFGIGEWLKNAFPNLAQWISDFIEHQVHPTVVQADAIKRKAAEDLQNNVRGCFGLSCTGIKKD